MTRRTTGARTAALALSLLGCLAGSMGAQAQSDDGPGFRGPPPPPPPPGQPAPQAGPGGPPPKKRHHDGDVGAAIGAGLVGGLVGGALLNGQRQAPPPYQQPAYAPPPPPPPAYEVEEEPVCRIIRKPVYDEDGEIVSYRTRRVCN